MKHEISIVSIKQIHHALKDISEALEQGQTTPKDISQDQWVVE